jgi:hypothetical protein
MKQKRHNNNQQSSYQNSQIANQNARTAFENYSKPNLKASRYTKQDMGSEEVENPREFREFHYREDRRDYRERTERMQNPDMTN